MPDALEGRIRAVFLKTGHGQPLQPVEAANAEAGFGLAGDASYGRSKRQVLIVEAETLAEHGLAPGAVRENLTVEGVGLAGLPAGTRFRAGDAVLEVTMDCAPCAFIDGLRPGLAATLEGRRGTLCRVVESGAIRRGDAVRLELASANER
jgi:MOSC domain-containing protein YiiM